MQHNEREMRRMVNVMEAFLRDGATAAVRITRRNLIKETPKRTQFAAGWALGLGGPPDIVPADKPQQTIYPLIGDDETDRDMAAWEFGDDVVLVSPATYIVYLNAGSSPQADENFIQDALTESVDQFRAWRWEGMAA